MKNEKHKCGCETFQGFSEKECKYHATHCHAYWCKKKSLKKNKYCKEHDWYNPDPNDMSGVDAYGGSDF